MLGPTATVTETLTPTSTITPLPGATLTFAPLDNSYVHTYTPTNTLTPSITPTATATNTPTATNIPQVTSISYSYDGDGNMVKSVMGDVVTYYIGSHYEKKVRGSQQNERKYYFAGANRIAICENGTLTWILTDHLGGTTVTADASGNLLSSLRYSAFGELRATSGTTSTDYRYTGQRSEAEIGLYYYVARFYDPALGKFISADTIVPGAGNPVAWDRYAYSSNNPINYNDPTGHAFKLDDDGNSRECPANTCYITLIGSTPGLPYMPVSPVSYGQSANNSSSGGGSMDAGTNTLPDVTNNRYTVKQPTYKQPSAVVDALGLRNDILLYFRNRAVEKEQSKINVFAFYKVGVNGYSVQSLDIQNPTGAKISVENVSFSHGETRYNAQPAPRIQSLESRYYGFLPIIEPYSTTTVSVIPSGYGGNQTNSFYDLFVAIDVLLVQDQTGFRYKAIQGSLR